MIQEKDLKIGMKVKIPKTKSVFGYGNIEDSTVIKSAIEKKQDYLFYIGKDEKYYMFGHNHYDDGGDFFALEDLELYEEEFVLPEKWGVRITEENRKILRDWVMSKKDFNKFFNTFSLKTFVVSKWYDNSYQCYNTSIKNLNSAGYTEITFEQFKQHVLKSQEEMKLPTENFGIKVTNRNGENIVKWFKEKEYDIKNFDGNSSNGAIYCVENDKILHCCLPPEISSVIKIYTLEEIKQIENQTKNNMKTKELLGYKLIKPEYKEAALKLSRVSEFSKSSQYDFVNNSICARNLKEAGVLDLWFEKVYKEEEKYKVGEWVSFYSETNKKTHTAKITKLGSSYHYLSDGTEPFVHLLRKATEEEILAATYKTVKLSIGKNVDIERDKLSNQVYILAEGKHIQYKYINNLYCNTNTFGDTNWVIQYNTFDIGCWKNVTRADLKLILDAYEEINGK